MQTSAIPTFHCGFCSKTYIYKGSLRAHEIKKYKNNKSLHRQYPLYTPLYSDFQQFCSTFINIVQKRLTSHRSTQGSKFIEFPCSENIFAFYFRNEENFQYTHYQRKYVCIFRELQGYQRIAKLFDFNEWGKKRMLNFVGEKKEKSFKYEVITFLFEINTETVEIVSE
ncbi:5863_t:CDS:2 [Gigaspora rosea]|nr:5863_t:CDS:2 [Gigaspora rosea]